MTSANAALETLDLTGIRIVRETRSRVRDLAGFLKSHKVPTRNDPTAAAFVERIAAGDLGKELEEQYSGFRRHFDFRRLDLRVSEPLAGRASIATPWFDYDIQVSQAPDDPAEVSWRRQLSGFRPDFEIRHPGLNVQFANSFDTVEIELPQMPPLTEIIDRIEAGNTNGVRLEYDRQATLCVIRIKGISGQVRLSQDRVALVAAKPQSALKLLEAFVRVRAQFGRQEVLRI